MAAKTHATLTGKGQLTFPSQIRKALNLKPGDKISFEMSSETGGKFTVQRKYSIFDRLDEMQLPPLGWPLTQADIEEAIDEAMLEQDARSKWPVAK